jgi:hypothetical protein
MIGIAIRHVSAAHVELEIMVDLNPLFEYIVLCK